MEALSPFSAPTAHLISCSGGNIWWPAGSHIGKALPLNPPAAPGWRWWSCLNLAFQLQRESSGKENDAERPPVASWEGRGTKEGRKAGGRGRCPSEVNDLFAHLTLNLPTMLEAEYGHLKEKPASERPPHA